MLPTLLHLGEQAGPWWYAVAGLLVLAEASVMVGVIFPGETALLVAGLAAHQGWINLWTMIVVAVAAAVVGDSIGYRLGAALGARLQASAVGRRVGARRWESTADFLNRHGGKAVVLGRFTAVLRALIPGMAGMSGMPYLRTFLPWNVLGGLGWASGCVLLGYGLSASLSTVGHYLAYGPLLLLVLVAAGLFALHTRRASRSW